MNYLRTRVLIAAAFVCLLFLNVSTPAQQLADPDFKPTVERPAYTKNFPRLLFDEGHNNFHTAMGRYKPFADLISNDGYHLVRGRKPFTKESLDTFKILVIANALGAEDRDDEGADHSAFADPECDAVAEWVRGGGSLLLIADEAPFSSAAANLAKRFNVEMGQAATRDPANHDKDSDNQSWIVYSRANKLLVDHPITAGRSDEEKISRVIVFGGQSLKGPDAGVAFLRLADTAVEVVVAEPDKDHKDRSSAGRAQGIALKFGKGRVVVLGEGDMLSALMGGPGGTEPIGMNYPGIDNKQLALNVLHWLSGLLKER